MSPNVPAISFRRFLLSRLLLLMLPILVVGVATTYSVTYRQARSALLETARQNLTESAIRYGDQLSRSIASLTSNLLITSQILSTSQDAQGVLAQLSEQQLPYTLRCLQTYQAQTQALMASTCGTEQVYDVSVADWPSEQPSTATLMIEVVLTEEQTEPVTDPRTIGGLQATNTLTLRVMSPVYREERLSQILVADVELSELASRKRSSLAGVPMIISSDQTILAHPVREQVGRSIHEQRDADRLVALVKNALQGDTKFFHLLSFTDTEEELLAGYTAIPSPLPQESDQQWVIVAFTQLNAAIAEVHAIQRVLLTLLLSTMVLLIVASVLVTLYLARATAQPIEHLRDALLDEAAIYQTSKIPRTSQIIEFNQLTNAVNSMIRRLVSWAEEIEGAWEEARTANQLKNEFLANISDQFRTPLNGLIGSLQILRHDLYESPEEQQEFVVIAETKALELKDLIDNMLTLALLERGEAEVDIERINLHDLWDGLAQTYETIAGQKQLILKVAALPTASLWVHGDRQKLQQVMSIVVDNAIKFTTAGQVTLQMQILDVAQSSISSPSGQVARMTIQDTGSGIDPKRQQHLFRPFVKAYDAALHSGQNAGLSLAIARNFMTLMGGDITLQSEGLEQGTLVWIDLPIAQKVQMN